MEAFWDYSVWGFFNIFAILLFSLLVANALKKQIPFLEASLIPTSVLAGILLLVFSMVYDQFSTRKDDIVNGTVSRIENKNVSNENFNGFN